MAEFPYPMWVVSCEFDGFVCTIWEKPGTGCSYIKHCPSCTRETLQLTRVDSKEEHERTVELANEAALI